MLMLIAGGLILTVGDIVQKQWAITHKNYLFWLGIAVWTIGSVFLAFAYQYKNMAVATVIYIMVNIVSLTLVSWYWYNEKLTPLQIFAVILAMIAVVILE